MQNEYTRQWIARRRAEWFSDKVCVDCGSRQELELDHVDPAKKVSHRVWSWSEERRAVELAKCVARCDPCHREKSAGEHAKGERNGMSKATDLAVQDIRSSAEPTRILAERHGLAMRTVQHIRKGDTW